MSIRCGPKSLPLRGSQPKGYPECELLLEFSHIRLRIYVDSLIFLPVPIFQDPTLLFRALSDATRLRCLVLLRREGKLCVCELTHATGLSQPKVSRHLAQLREMGLVQDCRAGQWVYYSLNSDLPAWMQEILEAASAGLGGGAPFAADRETLRSMSSRPAASCCA